MIGNQDVLDSLVTLAPGMTSADALVTFSDRHSELSGTLQTPAGQPADGFFVIVFPSDRALWLPTMRRLQSARPGTDGAFSFRDLPAGQYYLAALTDIDQEEWADAAFLSQVLSAAVRVNVIEGQQTVQALRIR